MFEMGQILRDHWSFTILNKVCFQISLNGNSADDGNLAQLNPLFR